VVTYRHTLSSRVCPSLTLVSNHDVDVRQQLLKLDFEELRDKRSRQIEGDDLQC
jgi:hypothetical protein